MLPSTATVLNAVCALLSFVPTSGQLNSVGPAEVCDDFAAGRHPSLGWTFDDCVDVWTRFEISLEPAPVREYLEADLWRDTAVSLRQQGSPCMLSSTPGNDGVGSTAIRFVATWILAEEMGCDWFTTNWASNQVQAADGSTRYCHPIVPLEERKSATNSSGVPGLRRCTVVNWLSYFQFDKHAWSPPSGRSITLIKEVSELFHTPC